MGAIALTFLILSLSKDARQGNRRLMGRASEFWTGSGFTDVAASIPDTLRSLTRSRMTEASANLRRCEWQNGRLS